ncbi:hypothetical protein LCGC14_2760570, partial [marine sediment metagenome]
MNRRHKGLRHGGAKMKDEVINLFSFTLYPCIYEPVQIKRKFPSER